jgi:protein SCO1/2
VWDERAAAAHHISGFELVDQSGERVSEAAIAGKIHIASFLFTSCHRVCPAMVGNLLRVQEAFAGDPGVIQLSFSVTPAVDTVPVLARYAREKGIRAAGWKLLTGDREQIYSLARDSYFADSALDRSPDSLLHSETVVLVDAARRIRGVYNGTLPLDVTRLIEDVETLKAAG